MVERVTNFYFRKGSHTLDSFFTDKAVPYLHRVMYLEFLDREALKAFHLAMLLTATSWLA